MGLDYYLCLNYVPGPYTLVEGIEKLRPGPVARMARRLMSRPAPSGISSSARGQRWTLDSAKEELDSLLADSVREHLISDVPLGVWSSGGLDSSTILHYAAAAAPGRLKTFSVSFHGRSFDESPYFRLVSERYGTDHHEFDLNPDGRPERRHRRPGLLLGRTQRRRRRSAGLVPVQDVPRSTSRSLSAAKAPTNCSAAT